MAVFDNFFIKGGRHPLATQRGLQKAIETLPTEVRRETLRKAAEWFASLDNAGLSAARQLDILLSFDSAVQKYRDLLWLCLRDSQSKDLAFVDARQALIEYCAVFSRRVDDLIDNVAQNDGEDIAGEDEVLVLAGRSLRTLAGWKRALYLDHEVIPPEIWSRLFVVLRLAFQWQAATREIRLYEHEAPTTLQCEFLRAVMLDTLPLANLTWRQIQITNTVLDHFADKFLLRAEPSQLTPYFLNLAQSNGPQHASRAAVPAAAVFVGPGAAFPEIVRLAQDISTHQAIPDWLTVPKNSKPAEIAKALTLAIRHWSRTPPQRATNRRRSTDFLQVLQGFQPIRNALNLVESGAKTNTPLLGYYANNPIYTTQRLSKSRRSAPEGAETWEIMDESPTGAGAVPKSKRATLVIGTLLGCFRPREGQWQVAVTRRTSHDRQSRFLVGMQFMAGAPYAAAVGLRAKAAGTQTREGTVWHDAIVLFEQKKLLLEHCGATPGMVALLRVGDSERHCIKLAKLEETHADWESWDFSLTTELEWATAQTP